MNSALEEIRDENILSACSLFENLPKLEKGLRLEKLKIYAKMLTEKEHFHILDLSDKIMISLIEIPWESITLPVFKYWCDLLMFEKMLSVIIMDNNSYENVMKVVNSVAKKMNRFFFRGLIHFKKMNIKIVDANEFEISVDSYKEELLMLAIERIKNCKTIQDLIDDSPNEECPVCMDVTFTEATDFAFRLGCNHLVCFSCEIQLAEFNNNWLVKNYFIFLSFDISV